MRSSSKQNQTPDDKHVDSNRGSIWTLLASRACLSHDVSERCDSASEVSTVYNVALLLVWTRQQRCQSMDVDLI